VPLCWIHLELMLKSMSSTKEDVDAVEVEASGDHGVAAVGDQGGVPGEGDGEGGVVMEDLLLPLDPGPGAGKS